MGYGSAFMEFVFFVVIKKGNYESNWSGASWNRLSSMVPAAEKKSSATVIKIVAGVHAEKNVEYFDSNR